MCRESGFQIAPIGHKLEKWQWYHNSKTWHQCQIYLILPILFSNLVISSSFMSMTTRGLTRNPEIGNTPVCILPNIWRLGRVRDTKFRMNVSNEMLLNAAKCQSYSFYCVWFIKGKRLTWIDIHSHSPFSQCLTGIGLPYFVFYYSK